MISLQEAIAKALMQEYGFELFADPGWIRGAEAVLGVLRADDDTRYVAMQDYERALQRIADGGLMPRSAAQTVLAKYDAVAPNAKDRA